MSIVDGNFLILPGCGKIEIYSFESNGSMKFTKKFCSLYGIFRTPLSIL